jgi:hypothetical protein
MVIENRRRASFHAGNDGALQHMEGAATNLVPFHY